MARNSEVSFPYPVSTIILCGLCFMIGLSSGCDSTSLLGYPDDPYAMVKVGPNRSITALGVAIKNGDKAQIQVYLDNGADLSNPLPFENPNTQTGSGTPPLIHAVGAFLRQGDEEQAVALIDFLIANGAKVNQASSSDITALHMAVIFGRRGVVEKLVSAGADVNARDERGNTPLARALEREELTSGPEGQDDSIADFLRSHGASE